MDRRLSVLSLLCGKFQKLNTKYKRLSPGAESPCSPAAGSAAWLIPALRASVRGFDLCFLKREGQHKTRNSTRASLAQACTGASLIRICTSLTWICITRASLIRICITRVSLTWICITRTCTTSLVSLSCWLLHNLSSLLSQKRRRCEDVCRQGRCCCRCCGRSCSWRCMRESCSWHCKRESCGRRCCRC